MNADSTERLITAGDVIRRFGLASLGPALLACEALSVEGAPLDVAVLGQFKSGKSSLLNTLLGEAVFPVGAVIEFISRMVTLEPGDLISTGTPAGVGATSGTFLKPGDVMRGTIQGIGTLVTPVAAER